MKIKIVLTISIIVLIVFLGNNLLRGETIIYDYSGECIQYFIKPVGKSEYRNLGTVDLKKVKESLATLNSKILFVDVSEKIFYDPKDSLPYKTERTNAGLWINEFRTEEYDQNKFTVEIKKFKGKKLVKQQLLKSDGPIQNINTLLYYLRKQPDLRIGWHLTAKVVSELKLLEIDLKLLSIDEIIVPGGKFQAYHFKSVPDTYEIWLDTNSPRIPLKIIIKGILNCSIVMNGYSPHNI